MHRAMEMLELYRAGELLARYPLGACTLEVGRALGCDVAVEDPDIAERHWLLLRRRGTVVAFDVSSGKRQRIQEYPLPIDRAVPLGRNHALRRVPALPAARREADTDTLDQPCCQ